LIKRIPGGRHARQHEGRGSQFCSSDGSLGEIEAWNVEGTNVLLSPPRQVPQAMPEVTLRKYTAVKAADATRPVFMTLTGYFLPFFKKWSARRRVRRETRPDGARQLV
jgi:hypothetical protein